MYRRRLPIQMCIDRSVQLKQLPAHLSGDDTLDRGPELPCLPDTVFQQFRVKGCPAHAQKTGSFGFIPVGLGKSL